MQILAPRSVSNRKFNITSDRILGQIVRKVLNLKHYPFTSKKPQKSKCYFGRIDEANARALLPTCNIPIEVKISSRKV
jgi:hypothetical protein